MGTTDIRGLHAQEPSDRRRDSYPPPRAKRSPERGVRDGLRAENSVKGRTWQADVFRRVGFGRRREAQLAQVIDPEPSVDFLLGQPLVVLSQAVRLGAGVRGVRAGLAEGPDFRHSSCGSRRRTWTHRTGKPMASYTDRGGGAAAISNSPTVHRSISRRREIPTAYTPPSSDGLRMIRFHYLRTSL
jgi:hypothetical protein